MFKKEVIKVVVAFCVGILLGVIIVNQGERELGLIMPVYCIGLLYGWKEIFKVIGKLTGASAKGGFYLTAFDGLFGLTITLVLYFLALSVILAFAWIIGIIKCIGALITAYNQDKILKSN